MNFSFQEFKNVISAYNGVILYRPLKDEVDYAKFIPLVDLPCNQLELPTDRNESPFVWAEKCMKYFGKGMPCILIPGTCFDMYGTRYGKGGGWYDCFLSKVPTTWLKVGITHTSRLSLERLQRQAWDQSMDFIIVNDKDSWDIYKTIT